MAVIQVEAAETVAQVVVEITKAVTVTQQETDQVIEADQTVITKVVAVVVLQSQAQITMVITKVDTAEEEHNAILMVLLDITQVAVVLQDTITLTQLQAA